MEEPPDCPRAHSIVGDVHEARFRPLQRRVSCTPGRLPAESKFPPKLLSPPRSAELAARRCSSCDRNRPRLARPPAPGTSRAARRRQVSSCTVFTDFLRDSARRRAADAGRSPPVRLFLSVRAGSRRRLEQRPSRRKRYILRTTRSRFRRRAHVGRAPPGCELPGWCAGPPAGGARGRLTTGGRAARKK